MVIGDNFIWLHLGKTGGTHIHRIFQTLPHLCSHIDGQHVDDRSQETSAPDSSEYRHDTIKKRQKKVGLDIKDKQIILNIRRLPTMIFSHHLALLQVMKANLKDILVLYREKKKKFGAKHAKTLFLQQVLAFKRQECLDMHNLVSSPDKLAEGKLSVYGSWWLDDPDKNEKIWISGDYMLQKYAGEHGIDHWIRMEHLTEDFIEIFQQISTLHQEDIEKIRALPRSNINPLKQQYKIDFTPEQLQKIYASNPFWADLERMLYGSALCD